MSIVNYISLETANYRKKWLTQVIEENRNRISSHLSGKRDIDLEKEIQKKKDTIMNVEDTLERFMNGILKIDIIAQALYEPSTRNVPKEMMCIEYFKSKGIKFDIEYRKDQASHFGAHSKIKKIFYKGKEIKFAIWSEKSNAAGITSKLSKLKNIKYKTPTIIIADGKNIKDSYLKGFKGKPNVKIYNASDFITWTEKN